MSYSYSQQVALALIPKFTGTLGITCSVFIITEIVRDYFNNEINPIKRALLGVTCFEILDAFGWWLSSWAVPSTEDFAFASGSVASCNFQGMLLQSAIGAPMNNLLLVYVFYLIVQGYDIKVVTSIETKTRPLIILFALGSGIVLLSLKQYNPVNQVCWVNGYPAGCRESIFRGTSDDPPCERGQNAYLYGIFFFYFVLWIIILMMTYLNISMRRFLLHTNSAEVHWVTTQALLFSLAFLITWTPSTLWSVLTYVNRGGYWLDILAATFEPMQGFWNLLIFTRNRPESINRIKRIFTCRCFSEIEEETEDADEELDDVDTKSEGNKAIPEHAQASTKNSSFGY